MTKELAAELLAIEDEHRGILSGAERTTMREAAGLLAATEPPTDAELRVEAERVKPPFVAFADYHRGYIAGARREGRHA